MKQEKNKTNGFFKEDAKPKKSFVKKYWLAGLVVTFIFIGLAIRGELHNRQLEKEKLDSNEKGIVNEEIIKPTTKAVLVLPFSSEDSPDSIAPMGETIIHNNTPNNIGHSGIDFQWHSNKQVNIVASMDAEIISITVNPLGSHDIITERGGWSVEYDGMELVNSELIEGQSIKRGDYLGRPKPEKAPTIGQGFHWQFGYYDKRQNRAYPALCPTTYFNNESAILIEKIWAETKWLEMKENAPDLCSNYYKDKNQ